MYIDLFAGCGGLSLGLHNAGWNGLFAVEKNVDAFATLKYNLINNKDHFNWPEWLEVKNIDINILLKQHMEELMGLRGTIDLVVGGPPCQGFSMAGKRQGNDLRNKLSNAYIEFVKQVQPSMIFFENVHGFTSGFTIKRKGVEKKGIPYSVKLKKALEKEGYIVASTIVKMSDYGVPQNRKRFILFATREKDPNRFFQILSNNREPFLNQRGLKIPINVKQAIGDLERRHGEIESKDTIGFMNGKYGRKSSAYQKLMRKNNKRGAIPDSHRFAKQKDETIELFERLMAVSNDAFRISPRMDLVEGLKKRGITPLKATTVCPTITSIPDDFIHYSEPRIMTVRESARMQSFPDDFEFQGKYTTGGSRRKLEVPRYTQVANAVPPLFAEQVGLALWEILNDE